jgi:hypothetical protein
MNQAIIPFGFDVPYCSRCIAHMEATKTGCLGALIGGGKAIADAKALMSTDCSAVNRSVTVREEKAFGSSYSSSTVFWHLFNFENAKYAELFCELNERATILQSQNS